MRLLHCIQVKNFHSPLPPPSTNQGKTQTASAKHSIGMTAFPPPPPPAPPEKLQERQNGPSYYIPEAQSHVCTQTRKHGTFWRHLTSK